MSKTVVEDESAKNSDDVVPNESMDRTFSIRRPKQRTPLPQSEAIPNEISDSVTPEQSEKVDEKHMQTPQYLSGDETNNATKDRTEKSGGSVIDDNKQTPLSMETLKQRMRTVRNRHMALRRSKHTTIISKKAALHNQRAQESQSSNAAVTNATSSIIEELKDTSLDDLETVLPQKITDLRSQLLRIKGKKKKKAFVQNLIENLPEKQKNMVTQMLVGR